MNNAGRVNAALEALTLAVIDNASITAMFIAETSGLAWDIIALKLGAGKKVSRARVLSAYKGSRIMRAVAA